MPQIIWGRFRTVVEKKDYHASQGRSRPLMLEPLAQATGGQQPHLAV
jgi:hypothetical protein